MAIISFFSMATAFKISHIAWNRCRCCSFKKNASALPNFLNENWIAPSKWFWPPWLTRMHPETWTQNLGFLENWLFQSSISWHWQEQKERGLWSKRGCFVRPCAVWMLGKCRDCLTCSSHKTQNWPIFGPTNVWWSVWWNVGTVWQEL